MRKTVCPKRDVRVREKRFMEGLFLETVFFFICAVYGFQKGEKRRDNLELKRYYLKLWIAY